MGGFLASLGMRPEIQFCLIAVVLGVTALATFPHLLPALGGGWPSAKGILCRASRNEKR
jgi:hypothetical protein